MPKTIELLVCGAKPKVDNLAAFCLRGSLSGACGTGEEKKENGCKYAINYIQEHAATLDLRGGDIVVIQSTNESKMEGFIKERKKSFMSIERGKITG